MLFVRFSFFFNDTATTEIYTLSLHDALPIFVHRDVDLDLFLRPGADELPAGEERSEEHTSELQSHSDLVCRLLLEKKKRVTDRGPAQVRGRVLATPRDLGPRCVAPARHVVPQ